MAIILVETDTAVTYVNGNSCGNIKNSTTSDKQATSGGTAGVTAVSLTLDVNSGGHADLVRFGSATNEPNNSGSWGAGTWTIRIEVTTANTAVTNSTVCVLRMNLNLDWTATFRSIGSNAADTNLTWATTGVKTATVTGSDVAAIDGASDRIAIQVAPLGSTMTKAVAYKPSQNIDTPVTQGAAAVNPAYFWPQPVARALKLADQPIPPDAVIASIKEFHYRFNPWPQPVLGPPKLAAQPIPRDIAWMTEVDRLTQTTFAVWSRQPLARSLTLASQPIPPDALIADQGQPPPSPDVVLFSWPQPTARSPRLADQPIAPDAAIASGAQTDLPFQWPQPLARSLWTAAQPAVQVVLVVAGRAPDPMPLPWPQPTARILRMAEQTTPGAALVVEGLVPDLFPQGWPQPAARALQLAAQPIAKAFAAAVAVLPDITLIGWPQPLARLLGIGTAQDLRSGVVADQGQPPPMVVLLAWPQPLARLLGVGSRDESRAALIADQGQPVATTFVPQAWPQPLARAIAGPLQPLIRGIAWIVAIVLRRGTVGAADLAVGGVGAREARLGTVNALDAGAGTVGGSDALRGSVATTDATRGSDGSRDE